MLNVTEQEIYEVAGPLDLTFLSKFCRVNDRADLHFKTIVPVTPPADFTVMMIFLRL